MLESDRAHARLREAGLRLTPQRRAVIEVLSGNTSHPTVESVAESVGSRMPGMSLSTVYKVLHELADLGLVRKVDAPGAMRFDPDMHEHLHVACGTCGTLVDTPLQPEVRDAIERAASIRGVSVHSVDILVHGTCEGCSNARRAVN
jgi:Fur family transcriptional regulator, peroxide stress response regulator